jgi:hypothetical protein
MSQTYTYRARTGPTLTQVTIGPDGLHHDGALLHRWSETEGIIFTGHRRGGRAWMSLTLETATGTTHLGFNGSGRDILDYHAMLRAVVGACADARPDLMVTRRYSGLTRAVLFVIGLVLAGVGGLLLAMAFDTGLHLDQSEDVTLFIMGAGFGLIGVVQTVVNLPGIPPPQEPVATFRKIVDGGLDDILS